MIWSYLMLIATSAWSTYLLWARRSRFVGVAVAALVLAILAYLTGLSIGFLIAPAALLLQTTALALHLKDTDHTPRPSG